MGPFANNPSRASLIFSFTFSPQRALFVSRAVYVCRPPHLGMAQVEIAEPCASQAVAHSADDLKSQNSTSRLVFKVLREIFDKRFMQPVVRVADHKEHVFDLLHRMFERIQIFDNGDREIITTFP